MRKIVILSFISLDGTMPAAFELTESTVTPKGVIFANYKRAGEVETGAFE